MVICINAHAIALREMVIACICICIGIYMYYMIQRSCCRLKQIPVIPLHVRHGYKKYALAGLLPLLNIALIIQITNNIIHII